MWFFIVIRWKHVSYIMIYFFENAIFFGSSKNLMVVNERVWIIYPSLIYFL